MKKITLLFALLAFCWQINAQFTESFDTEIPATWTILNEDGGANTWVHNTVTPHAGAGSARITYESAAHDDYLITPQFAVTIGTSDRISFYAGIDGTTWTETFDVKISTTGSAAADFTTTIASETANTDADGNYTKYEYDLTAYDGMNVYVAIVATDTNRFYLYVDEFVNDAIPSTPAACTSNETATPDASCGNFETVLSWDAVSGVNGYYLTVGTSTGANNIYDDEDLGDVTTYNLTTQEANTQYFWTVTPYNLVGPATGCTEYSYTTAATGCYCDSVPTSNDGTGISNLQVATTDFTSGGDIMYEDFTGSPVDLGQGVTANVMITFATGYTYDTHIWVDLNDDNNFEASELLYSGVSLADNPTTLDASFTMPAAAALGTHRMRIGTADSGQATPNACYNGTYGVTMDVDINIVTVSCTPAVATATMVPDCNNSQFNVDVDVTTLGDAVEITDGTSTWPVTTTGVVTVGPFADGSSVSLSITHSDTVCDVALGSYTNTCPAANDECMNAIDLDAYINADSSCTLTYTGSNIGATYSSGEVAPSGTCTDISDGTPADIWFSITVPVTGGFTYDDITIPGISSMVEVYTGTCGSLTAITPVNCTNTTGLRTFDGLTAGDTVYIRYWDYGSNDEGALEFCVAIAPPANDDCADAEVISLATDYTGDTTYATDSGVAAGACGAAGGDQDIWYAFDAPTSGEVLVTTDADHIVIYDSCGGTELHCVADQAVVTGLTAATTYYVRIYNSGSAKVAGPVALRLEDNMLLSTDRFVNTSLFNYYPNPVKNTLTLNAQKAITNVAVYNMLGQTVIKTAPNAVSNELDMSRLQAGAYFVQVTIDNTTETVKIIKQ